MPQIIDASAMMQQAVTALQQGALVAMPTETVYGLAGNATDDAAVRLIYATKSRPAHNPLIVHIASIADAYDLAHIVAGSVAEKLMQKYWQPPADLNDGAMILGALTLVLTAKENSALSKLLITDEGTIALRLPHHPTALELIAKAGFPLAAPSANLSGQLTPTRAEHVMRHFADLPQPHYILTDPCPCHYGIESTIIDARGERLNILRQGSWQGEDFADIAQPEKNTPIIAPGMLSRHYAPNSRLRLNASNQQADELMLGFGKIDGDLNLSPAGDLMEAAHHFYDYLFQLDQMNSPDYRKIIAVAKIPAHDMGIALNDRLARAIAR